RPVQGKTCPECGSFLIEPKGKSKGYRCANPKCTYWQKS
ncbi:MAG TPA: hypothetical protein GX524_02620, partial [Firmicutes bacterium]|nr:hypothetical protein [Bacillota bacterium]